MTTRRERLEAKLEKRQEWAESRRRKAADAAYDAAAWAVWAAAESARSAQVQMIADLGNPFKKGSDK